MEWLILQLWFCSVGSPPASLQLCIEVIIHIELKQGYCEILSPNLQFLQSYLEIFICHLASAVPLLESDNISPVCRYIMRYDLFWWLVPEKIGFCLQYSRTKYQYFIWAKRSIARRAVMVHSARRIALLLATFEVALPSEREKPRWIDWTIEIFPSTHWGLLCLFPARRSRFRVCHRATYCLRRSLTSYHE